MSYNMLSWRGRIVVECATLERWYIRKGIEGSNPSLSARSGAVRLSCLAVSLLVEAKGFERQGFDSD